MTLLKNYKKIVVLTGAGVSAESNIKTFRGAEGLWEGYPVDQVATPEAFLANPDLVYKFYNERRRQLLSDSVSPNDAHIALAEFEKRFSGDFLIVTQNVDNLHERAGSKNVIHMHGELLKVRGVNSCKVLHWEKDLNSESRDPAIGDEILRPHIVWFGEMPLMMPQIEQALWECDLFVSLGTSGNVYPAAGFVSCVSSKAETVELNLDETRTSGLFKNSYRGPASKIVREFFGQIK